MKGTKRNTTKKKLSLIWKHKKCINPRYNKFKNELCNLLSYNMLKF